MAAIIAAQQMFVSSIEQREILWKSILHLDCAASDPTRPLFISQSLLDPHFTGRSPLSVIDECEIWAYRGITVRQHLKLNPDNNNIHAINCTLAKKGDHFHHKRHAGVMYCVKIVIIRACNMLRCEAPSSIYLTGISWTGISRLTKMNPEINPERSSSA